MKIIIITAAIAAALPVAASAQPKMPEICGFLAQTTEMPKALATIDFARAGVRAPIATAAEAGDQDGAEVEAEPASIRVGGGVSRTVTVNGANTVITVGQPGARATAAVSGFAAKN